MNPLWDLGAVEHLDRDLFSTSELFHENSKIRRTRDGILLGPRARGMQPSELSYAEAHGSKTYRSAAAVRLADGPFPLTVTIEHALRTRRSIRAFSKDAVAFDSLCQILDLSYGVTSEALSEDRSELVRKRAAPAAGALYTNDLYAFVLGVEDLEQGLYHHQPQDRSLECLRTGDLRKHVADSVLYPEIIAEAAVVFVIAAIFHRSRAKYGERAYRYALLDAGHIAQNICLVSAALNLGAVTLGGFLDDGINDLLGMNGVDEAVLYLIATGRPAFPSSVAAYPTG